jgi:hypothetical protein
MSDGEPFHSICAGHADASLFAGFSGETLPLSPEQPWRVDIAGDLIRLGYA